MRNSLDLHVSVPADEFAYLKRRVVYLEAVLMRVVRDSELMREWFAPAEIAGMGLPGLPDTPEGVTRKANKERWRRRKTRVRGSWMQVIHVTSLPARAFDALVSMILELPDINETAPLVDVLPPPPIPKPAISDANTAPPWVLPLMRIMKRETSGNLSEAWQILPERLPPDVALPTVEEAAAVLVRFGLAGK
ncbi:hypothetical protein MUU53_01680 [Rhizobium lemnae]|uniref:DNA-binding protein n=1 Tax=Rhizobium lemnae TaxID=1214924 RepID=A0ABV8E4P4_9HYPH|nr:DNA-binding protein [Rhizobium lemnae]MCJ8506616.1 hypothetical protein [Rhizobium lemnae]